MKLELLVAAVRRGFATVGVALTLLLVCAAASPQFHSWFHADDAPELDAGCVVTVFAAGLTVGAVVLVQAARTRPWIVVWSVAPRPVYVAPARYLRQPERGPPFC